MSMPEDFRTPFQDDRDRAERTGTWPEGWGPFHRHFASGAIHRDGGPECDQPGTPRRVYVFDDDVLDAHERAVARWGTEQAGQAAESLIRGILESLCRRDGLSTESAADPGQPARNYELADRLGIGHVFGLPA